MGDRETHDKWPDQIRRLDSIAEIAVRFNALSDTATHRILWVQEQLTSCGIGLTVLATDERPGFVKYGGNWMITCRDGFHADDVPVMNASRGLRIWAAKRLDALLEAIAGEGTRVLALAESAVLPNG